MIEFSGTLDGKTYAHALRSMIRSMSMAPLLIVLALYFLRNATPEKPATWAFPLFLLSLAVVLVIWPWMAARKMKSSELARGPFSGRADEEHFVWESPHSRSDIPWPKLHHSVIASDVVLLYTSPVASFIIPRLFFRDDAAWSEFTRLVAGHTRVRRSRPGRLLLMLLGWFVIALVFFIVRDLMH